MREEAIDFGRGIAADLASAQRREWLVTNGLGGFASGTIAGVATRRYHGLLVAALQPPVGRRYLVSSLDATAHYGGRVYELYTNRWADGTSGPAGYLYVERFVLEGSVPLWTYALADALLEKRIWMEPNVNRTYVSYAVTRGTAQIALDVKALVNDRDFHAVTRAGDWRMNVEPVAGGVRMTAYDGAVPFVVRSDRGSVVAEHTWHRDHLYAEERERGLDALDDWLHAASFALILEPGDTVTFELGLEGLPAAAGALERRRAHDEGVMRRWQSARLALAAGAPPYVRRLVLAADQFSVARPLASDPGARSIVAGYPWFGDWGRDTMIALPGLMLATGDVAGAARILETFARYVASGLLPNYFPDAGERPEYNTVDAALWFVEAVRLTLGESKDIAFLRRVFPALLAIAQGYRDGTTYGIGEDATDGLIAAGAPGVALTWMDAKVGDWVVTPRSGKPVEINALWLRAQLSFVEFARLLDDRASAERFGAGAERTRAGLQRYWNAERGCLYDVLDGPDGNDASLRPNQLFAVSLPIEALTRAQQRSIVDVCARELLTTLGLRSLAPSDSRYRPQYRGTPRERDGAYHQGTVWGWLAGPFATAVWRAYGDRSRALAYVETLARELDAYGVGTLPEIADAEAPHRPRGAIAQAWTVGEVLRAWTDLSS